MNQYTQETALTPEVQSSMWNRTVEKMAPEATEKKARIFSWFKSNFLPITITIFVAGSIYLANPLSVSNNLLTQTTQSSVVKRTDDALIDYENAPVVGVQSSVGKSGGILGFLQQSPNTDTTTQEKFRIKDLTSELRYTVNDISDAVKQLYTLITDYKGFVINSQISKTQSIFAFKIPLEKFQEFRERVNLIGGKLTYEQTNTIDKQDKLTTLEQSKKMLADLIKKLEVDLKNAKSDTERKTIKNNIAREKESLDIQEESIKKLVAETRMATVSVTFSTDDSSFVSQLQLTLSNTFATLGKGLIFLLNFGIILLAVAIPVKLALMGIHRIFRKKRSVV